MHRPECGEYCRRYGSMDRSLNCTRRCRFGSGVSYALITHVHSESLYVVGLRVSR